MVVSTVSIIDPSLLNTVFLVFDLLISVMDPSGLNTVLEFSVAISLLSVRHKKRKVSGTLDIPGFQRS